MGYLVESPSGWGPFFGGMSQTPKIVELGVFRSVPSRPTHHKSEILSSRPQATYIGSDFKAGVDVDVVADCHDLVSVFGEDSLDGLVAIAVWEHLRRPWVAGEQVRRVLKPGGTALIVTHQTFPLHGYPSDYFRFSTDGLKECFDGMDVVAIGYEHRCTITPPPAVKVWDPGAPCFLNVHGVFRKR